MELRIPYAIESGGNTMTEHQNPMKAMARSRREPVERLCRVYHVKRLDLFGSAAGGEFDPVTSDIDLLVEFEELDPGRYADTYFGLKEALEALFGRPVDLVMRSAVRNPYFLSSIEATKSSLYAA
jgi:hypothetical protein